MFNIKFDTYKHCVYDSSKHMFTGVAMTDRDLIKKEGGAYQLAKRLNYPPQRVQNWVKRGIPAKEKLKFPFLNAVTPHQSAT